MVTKPRRRSGRRRYRIVAACAVLALSLVFAVQKSPAFAGMVKGIPGFSIVSDCWTRFAERTESRTLNPMATLRLNRL